MLSATGTATLSVELGADFVLREQEEETHTTPQGREQIFNFFRFQRVGP